MLQPEDCALVLLAAGRSLRFAGGDKLAEPFLHEPLGLHVVTALAGVPFRTRIAVISDTGVDFAARGYRIVRNAHPERGQAGSLALLVAAAQEADVAAVVVALADMPRVTGSHIYHLLDAGGPEAIVASSDGVEPRMPALFGRDHFAALMDPGGLDVARDLVRRGRHVVTTPAELVDIDTQDDLRTLRERYGVRDDRTHRESSRTAD